MRLTQVHVVPALLLAITASGGCKAGPALPAAAPPAPPAASLDTRVSWILRLEHQRMVRDPDVLPGESVPPGATSRLRPARAPDLVGLLNDTDAGVRRRAALAIGRIGRSEGIDPLAIALADPDEGARGTAAFALGLIGSRAAVEPVSAALKDASLTVRARAVEALGLIGDPASAAAVADTAVGCRERLGAIAPDDEGLPKSPDVELCRLALFSLVRLKSYDQLARVALDERGEPVSRWWPVAFALQRIGDRRAVPALLRLAETEAVYTPAFALRGLAAAREVRAAPLARAIAARATADLRLRVAAVRAVGELGGPGALETLVPLAKDRTARALALEAVTALGQLGDARAFDVVIDMLTDPWPSMRAALVTAAARLNPEAFLLVASGMAADPDWSVRAALAEALAALPPDQVRGELIELSRDTDARVQGPALRALARVGAPDLPRRLFEALDAQDFVVRATAASIVGEMKPAGGIERLAAAYARGESDAAFAARAAALQAAAAYGTDDALALVRRGLADKAWPVRWRAAELLRAAGDATAAPALPAPLREPPAFFESAKLLHPTFSPHAFLETRAGTIEIELNLVEAPITSQTFVDLARLGFFNGIRIHRVVPNFVIQGGDPRGDGEGGPGFTIMDELSPIPYVRGTVGMALDWRDTAGSQFFIAVSPQPHLDARYTVFGRVVQGDQVLDRLLQWDVIERVRIWDGTTFQ